MSDFIPSESMIKRAEKALNWIIANAKSNDIDQLVDETGEIIVYKSFTGNLPIRMTDDIRLVYGYEKSIIINGHIVRPQNLNKNKGGANRWMFLINNTPSLTASQYFDLSHNLSNRIEYFPYTNISNNNI